MKKLSVFLGACFCLASFAADPVVPPPAVPAPVTPAPVTPTPVKPPAVPLPPVAPPAVPGKVTVRPVTPEQVTGELVADKVVEVALINRVQIMAPRFVFSKDFGYGTEILPDLRVGRDTTTISHWVCAQFGYGKAVGTFGTRSVISKVLMESRSFGRPAKANDLVTTSAFTTTVAANLTCAKI